MKEKVEIKLNEIAIYILEFINKPKVGENNYGLYTGDFGILVFLAYYRRYVKSHKWENIFDKYTDCCLEKFNDVVYSYYYSGGVAGMLQCITHLNKYQFMRVEISEANEFYVTLLTDRIIYDIKNNNYDFISGATGIAKYLTNNKCDNTNIAISNFLDFALSEIINNTNRINDFIDNISLSHGMSSLLIIVCDVYKKSIHIEKAKLLINIICNYILSQQIDNNKYGSYFTSLSINQNESNLRGSRLAWCYGDLGVATALWQAGETLNNQQWKDKAIEVFKFSTTRTDLKANMVNDAGLCHGTAGIAHMFKRMYIETNIEDFRIANEYWISETMKMARFDDGVAGFKAFHRDGWVIKYSLLEGIAGIGLSLISYLSEDNNNSSWDELLLMSSGINNED